jgi:hypothetical protein
MLLGGSQPDFHSCGRDELATGRVDGIAVSDESDHHESVGISVLGRTFAWGASIHFVTFDFASFSQHGEFWQVDLDTL